MDTGKWSANEGTGEQGMGFGDGFKETEIRRL